MTCQFNKKTTELRPWLLSRGLKIPVWPFRSRGPWPCFPQSGWRFSLGTCFRQNLVVAWASCPTRIKLRSKAPPPTYFKPKWCWGEQLRELSAPGCRECVEARPPHTHDGLPRSTLAPVPQGAVLWLRPTSPSEPCGLWKPAPSEQPPAQPETRRCGGSSPPEAQGSPRQLTTVGTAEHGPDPHTPHAVSCRHTAPPTV